ncbi:9126_t:CDS:2 [Acaulospora morrowiae]|uniref:9126_t:CDS:1 n=1 Tax=Acaulospora morrowiae TaxID=94023 RepID=A0A9N9HFV1_9GLOM|nr:9126_t:CDS:2 [Acaulospora morrowiae]
MGSKQNDELFPDENNKLVVNYNSAPNNSDSSVVTNSTGNSAITYTSSDAIPIRKKNEYARSINSFSSILSDQTSPNLYWAPSSFSSMTSFDHLFSNSKRASTSGLSLFGMNSVPNLDPVTQETLLKEKVKKASADMELFMRQLYNDSSLGMYHMSEHIRKRVPLIVEEKRGLIALSKELDVEISDIKDSHEIVESIPKIQAFNNISEMLKNTIGILEEVKGKDKRWRFWEDFSV